MTTNIDRAIDGAAGGALSNEQKRDIVMWARKAWELAGRPGCANQQQVQEQIRLTQAEAFDLWRQDEQMKAVGKHHLTSAQNFAFPALMAHFARLAGQPAIAEQWLKRTALDGRRQAMAKLQREMYLAHDVIEKPGDYVGAICWAKCKCRLEAASPKQLWMLMFDIRRAAQKRRAKGSATQTEAMRLIGVVVCLAALALPGRGAEVTLAWDPPTNNTDGTPLTDLAGYKLYSGQASQVYSVTTDVGNVLERTYSFAAPAGSWSTTNIVAVYSPQSVAVACGEYSAAGTSIWFAVSCYNVSGIESDKSEELEWTSPAVAGAAYRVRYGTVMGTLTNVVPLAGREWTAARSKLPATIVYASFEVLCDGGWQRHPIITSINNRRGSYPKNLRVSK